MTLEERNLLFALCELIAAGNNIDGQELYNILEGHTNQLLNGEES